MNNKQNCFVVILAVVAGFLGGFLSNQIFSAGEVFAGNEAGKQKLVNTEFLRANQVDIVDENGMTRLVLGNYEGKGWGVWAFDEKSGKASNLVLSINRTEAFVKKYQEEAFRKKLMEDRP